MSKEQKPRLIQVHSELYRYLVIMKGADMQISAEEVTFADVIATRINRANHFAQLISRLIRTHPETKKAIEDTAKSLGEEHYKLVEPMLRCIKSIDANNGPS